MKIENLTMHRDRQVPGQIRAWRCPVSFDLAGQRFETLWEYDEAIAEPDHIQRILADSLLLLLRNDGFQPIHTHE
jgi:hypothetical protein